MTDQTSDEVTGDRGAVLDGRRKLSQAEVQRRGMIVMSGGLVAGLLGIAYFSTSEAKRAVPLAAKTIRTVAPLELAVPANVEPVQVAAWQGRIEAQQVAVSGKAPKLSETEEMFETAKGAPLVAFSGGGWGDAPTGSGGVSGQMSPESSDKGEFEKRLTAPKLEGSRAAMLGDLNMVIPQGVSIPCVLETALQSDQAGFASCQITRDVMGANGRVVLMESGTQVVGEYRGGLNAGQNRLHVLWTSARTPTGVVIDLGSPATDTLGRAGFDGRVDTHFMERFGAAILLSVVQDISAIGAQQLQSEGIKASGTTGSGNTAAALAVEQSAGIKPTLHKNQGEMVSIFVARKLDFSSVYSLEAVGERTGRTARSLK